ncbi:MAG: hypothetical protein ACR2N7_03315, partial [Acidimicrobiia bacterium]
MTIIAFLVGLLLFMLFAWTARRLLGVVRLSAVKTTLSAIAGLLVAALLTNRLLVRGFERDEAYLLGLAIGLIAMMVVIIAFEFLAKPGRRPI